MRGLGRGFGAGGPGVSGLASCVLGSVDGLRGACGEELLDLSDGFSVTGGGTWMWMIKAEAHAVE